MVGAGDQRRPRRAGRARSSAPATGASTRSSTAARSPCAARSSTCSRPPPTRPSASTCGATRSTGSPSSPWPTSARPSTSTEVEIFPCRELLPTDEVRERAAALDRARAVGPRAVGAPGRGPDLRRHGVAGCRGSPTTSTCCSTSSAADAQVLLVEPRRMRDRAADILAEEADLAAHAGHDVGRRRRPSDGFPRLHLAVRPAARPHRRAGVDASPSRPRAPTSPPSPPLGWDPVVGDGERARRASSRELLADGYRVVVAADGAGSADRLVACSASRAAPRPRRAARRPHRARRPRRGRAARAGLSSCRRSSWPSWPSPTSPVGAGPTAGPGPASAAAPGLLRRPQARRPRRAPPARRRPLRRHGQAGHRRRRARLPAARVPGRRQALRPVRPDRRRAPLHRRRHARRLSRLGGGDWQKTKAKVRAAVAEIAQELVVLYQTRRARARPRLRRTTRRGSASSRTPSRTRRRPTSSRPSTR